jgi:hypothetical protein
MFNYKHGKETLFYLNGTPDIKVRFQFLVIPNPISEIRV